ncbi:MAG: hypothetical protein ACHQ51_06135 [Elusimicrobiota bacterium]
MLRLVRRAGAVLLLLAPLASASDLEDSFAQLQDRLRARTPASPEASPASARPDGDLPDAYRAARAPLKDARTGDSDCRATSLAADGGFDYCVNEADYHEFTLRNSSSPRINPTGRGVHRDYSFSAPENARQELGLFVYEWASLDPGADDSASSMLSEILFFPRRVTPSVRLTPDGASYEATLPTGETVLFEARTKEILGGVLTETAPIDTNQDRHARAFAALRYSGGGIMLRSDQRGDSPRSSVVWGQKKYATVVWGAKTCRVSTADVWKQDASGAGSANLYPTDEGFYSMLGRKCGWTVTAASFP